MVRQSVESYDCRGADRDDGDVAFIDLSLDAALAQVAESQQLLASGDSLEGPSKSFEHEAVGY
ncbi:MAG: hypothetical protein ACJAYU_005345 [Bradymonadia bacterium]